MCFGGVMILEEPWFWLIMAGLFGVIIWLTCCDSKHKGGMYDD